MTTPLVLSALSNDYETTLVYAPHAAVRAERRGARRDAATSSNRRDISPQVLSQEVCARYSSTRRSQSAPRPRPSRADSTAATNSSGLSAMLTSPVSPYGRTTSRIEVETTGLPAARYSGVFVGLMNLVASLRAKSSKATSQPAM